MYFICLIQFQCTLERPHCSQCTNSGRECPGYMQERVFVTSTAPSKPSRWRQTSYSKPSHAPAGPDRGLSALTRRFSIVRNGSMNKCAYRYQLLGVFLSRFDSSQPDARSGSWMLTIPDLSSKSRTFEVAALALCTSKLARENHDDEILIQRSLGLYGESLQALQAALSNRQSMVDDQTLGACLLLAMYEVLECPSKDRLGYLSHYSGCARLIQLRGPEAHVTGLGHLVFIAFRTMEVRATPRTYSIAESNRPSNPSMERILSSERKSGRRPHSRAGRKPHSTS